MARTRQGVFALVLALVALACAGVHSASSGESRTTRPAGAARELLETLQSPLQGSRILHTIGGGDTRHKDQRPRRRELQEAAESAGDASVLGRVSEMEGELDASCNATLEAELRAFFRGVVLIVHCDDEEHEPASTHFWSSVYRRFFGNIVFIAANPVPQLGVEARGSRPFRWDWHYSYFALPKIMARYPKAEGFLWVADDVIINYWNLLQANKSKVWLPNHPAHPETRTVPLKEDAPTDFPDDWATAPEHRAKARAAWNSVEPKFQEQYIRSIEPQKGVFQKRVCDFFYIPRRAVEALSFDLLPPFRESRVASQMAIPTMLYMLEHPTEFDHVLDDMVYEWSIGGEHTDEEKRPRKFWKPEAPGMHPWRVGDETGQKEALRALSMHDPCVLRQFPGVDIRSADGR